MSKQNNIYKIQHTQFKFNLPLFQPVRTSATPEASDSTHNSVASSRKWSKCQRCQPEMPLPFMPAFFSEIRAQSMAVCSFYLVEEMFCSLWESSPLTYKSSSLTCKRISDLAAEQQQPVNDCKKKETNTLLPRLALPGDVLQDWRPLHFTSPLPLPPFLPFEFEH